MRSARKIATEALATAKACGDPKLARCAASLSAASVALAHMTAL